MIGVLSSPLRTTDIKRCAPLAALWGGMRHWTHLGRHTRRTAHPQPHYSPTPVTAHSGHQTRNGATRSKKIGVDFAKIRRASAGVRCVCGTTYYTLGERAPASPRPRPLRNWARAAAGRAGGYIPYRLREGRGARAINA